MHVRERHIVSSATVRLLLSTFLLIDITACAGYFPGERAHWDAKVKELCEQDGGVTVFEIVEISHGEYARLGGSRGVVPVPDETRAQAAPYFARTVVQEVNANPRVLRRETRIVRTADQKVLGKVVSYSRIGGDVPTGIGHHSSFSCRDIPGFRADVERQIFVVKGSVQ
jgi:hypothetical protein